MYVMLSVKYKAMGDEFMEIEHEQDINMVNEEFRRDVNKASFAAIGGNIVLAVAKIAAGIFAHSHAMISDGVHTASDVFNTFIVMAGVKVASKSADEKHPYGHERFECVAAVILSVILIFMGLGIGSEALSHIFEGNYSSLAIPGKVALIVAACSIFAKEAMFWYMRYYARKTDSSALLASAWHNRSDALSSVSSFIGIGFSMLGFPIMDSVASLLISIFILKAAYDIFRDSTGKMVDRSCDGDTVQRMHEIVLQNERVVGVDMLKTRVFGSRIYVDLEISVDEACTLRQAHDIAHQVENDIETNLRKVKHVMVHVNPADEDFR